MPLPATIPIFPLPNVVLFPNVFLPLHIFEPRYRAMVKDALEADRIIGMVLLRPGFESDYAGRPPVYPIGCAGLITHSEPLPDGRFNIVLRGLEKFRMVGEEPGRPYRTAQIEPLSDVRADPDRTVMRRHRVTAMHKRYASMCRRPAAILSLSTCRPPHPGRSPRLSAALRTRGRPISMK